MPIDISVVQLAYRAHFFFDRKTVDLGQRCKYGVFLT
jgi:hypothetical protein